MTVSQQQSNLRALPALALSTTSPLENETIALRYGPIGIYISTSATTKRYFRQIEIFLGSAGTAYVILAGDEYDDELVARIDSQVAQLCEELHPLLQPARAAVALIVELAGGTIDTVMMQQLAVIEADVIALGNLT